DARTDIFSFGSVLYEMGTGTLPFQGGTSATVFDSILNRQPVAPVRLNSRVPPELERIINKCLEKDRELRYQHASDIRTDLQRLKRDSESGRSAPVAVQSVAKKKMWPAVAAIVLLAALLSAGGYFFTHRSSGKLTEKDTVVIADFDNTS